MKSKSISSYFDTYTYKYLWILTYNKYVFQVRSTECTTHTMCTSTLPLHWSCCGPNLPWVCSMILVSAERLLWWFIWSVCIWWSTRHHSVNLFSAGSVVRPDPTVRLHLMNGLCSPVKVKNVVPHDIGDPGRRKTRVWKTCTTHDCNT